MSRAKSPLVAEGSAAVVRIDTLLVRLGLARSRAQAGELIAAGLVVWLSAEGPQLITKPSFQLPAQTPAEQLQITSSEISEFVSRGGRKLDHALRQAELSVVGCTVLDVGQSTGGFTDCLLRAGARAVVGIDVGQNQLAEKLVHDPRVYSFEKTHILKFTQRELSMALGELRARTTDGSSAVGEQDQPTESRATVAAESAVHHGSNNSSHNGSAETSTDTSADAVDLVVIDVSFISLCKVLGKAAEFLRGSGAMLALVKPQFEVGPEFLNRQGVVRDPGRYVDVEQTMRKLCAGLALSVTNYFPSHITGADGNREFWLVAKKS